jgi:hypothetical protein
MSWAVLRPPAGVLERGEPGDHAGVRRAGHGAHDDGVEEDAELPLLLGHFVRPVREPEPAQPVLGRARGDGVGLAPGGLDLLNGVLPGSADADVEPCRVEPRVGPHDAREQDVADLVVARIVPVDPAFLDEPDLEAELGADRGHLARVVGLVAADRHERVRTGGEHVRHDVLQLPGLVAAVGQTAVAVLPLGPDLGAAQMGGEPVEPVDGAGPEGEREALEVGDGHRVLRTSWAGLPGSRARKPGTAYGGDPRRGLLAARGYVLWARGSAGAHPIWSWTGGPCRDEDLAHHRARALGYQSWKTGG